MILGVVAFLGGALTILSPCILPVLPFVLARTEQPFARSTLPLLIGMAAPLPRSRLSPPSGAAGRCASNDYGRIAALVLLTLSALALLSRHVAEWLARPLVALGARLLPSPGADGAGSGVTAALLVVSRPGCCGRRARDDPGPDSDGAAIRGPSAGTTVLLFAYALGAASSLAVVALTSSRVLSALKRTFGAGEWLRRSLGAPYWSRWRPSHSVGIPAP